MNVWQFGGLVKRNFIQGTILLVVLFSFFWLIGLVLVLNSRTSVVELEYKVYVENADYSPIKNPQVMITEEVQHEDALFKAFAEAEEHLRNQLNSWLTILGFFAVIFGLLMPLINYLLQRQTLEVERSRMVKEFDAKMVEAVAKVDEMAKDAKTKAESAMTAASEAKNDVNALKTGSPSAKTSKRDPDLADAKNVDVVKEAPK